MGVNHGYAGDFKDEIAVNWDFLELGLMDAVSQISTRMEVIYKKSIETKKVVIHKKSITEKMSI